MELAAGTLSCCTCRPSTRPQQLSGQNSAWGMLSANCCVLLLHGLRHLDKRCLILRDVWKHYLTNFWVAHTLCPVQPSATALQITNARLIAQYVGWISQARRSAAKTWNSGSLRPAWSDALTWLTEPSQFPATMASMRRAAGSNFPAAGPSRPFAP